MAHRSLPLRITIIYIILALVGIGIVDTLISSNESGVYLRTALLIDSVLILSTSIVLYAVLTYELRRRSVAEEALRQAEMHALKVTERATERAERLQVVALALSGALDTERVAEVVIKQGLDVMGASGGTLALLSKDGTTLTLVQPYGLRLDKAQQWQQIPITAPVPITDAVRMREAIFLESISEFITCYPQLRNEMANTPHTSWAVLPLLNEQRVLGSLAVTFTTPQHFDAADRAFMQTLAQQGAQALERAQLYDAERRARERLQALSQRLLEAQEGERRQIARELHDETGQALTALKINLHMLQTIPDPKASTHRLHESMSLVDRLLEQVRTLALDLRPSVLDDLGLVAALEWYVDRMAQRTGLVGEVIDRLEGLHVPPAAATVCFRVAQEALTNTVRHAQARRVSVEIGRDNSAVTMSIRDDGTGFDVQAQQARARAGQSLGILGMVERVELAGGRIAITTALGEGTAVSVWLPLPD